MVDKYLDSNSLDTKHQEILINIKHIIEMHISTTYKITNCIYSFNFPKSTFYRYLNIIISEKTIIKQSNRPKCIRHQYD